MNISKRERTLIIVVVLLALIGAYYLYYLKPCLDEVNSLNLDIENKKVQLSASAQQQTQHDQLEAQIEDKEEQIALYGDNVAQAFDQPPVLVYLSDTVSDYAQKGSISFDQPRQTGQIEHCAITITMTSTYNGLKKVLDAFADAPYLIRITQLSASNAALGAESVPQAGAGTGDTAGTGTTASLPKALETRMVLDFYSLSGDIPADTTYEFDTARQYGGDIFY